MTFAWVTIEGTVMHSYPTYCLTEFCVAYRMAARPLMCTQGQKQQAQSDDAGLGVILSKVIHSGSYKDVSVVLGSCKQCNREALQAVNSMSPPCHKMKTMLTFCTLLQLFLSPCFELTR